MYLLCTPASWRWPTFLSYCHSPFFWGLPLPPHLRMDVWNDPSPSYHLNLELPVSYHPHPQCRTLAAEALHLPCPLSGPTIDGQPFQVQSSLLCPTRSPRQLYNPPTPPRSCRVLNTLLWINQTVVCQLLDHDPISPAALAHLTLSVQAGPLSLCHSCFVNLPVL